MQWVCVDSYHVNCGVAGTPTATSVFGGLDTLPDTSRFLYNEKLILCFSAFLWWGTDGVSSSSLPAYVFFFLLYGLICFFCYFFFVFIMFLLPFIFFSLFLSSCLCVGGRLIIFVLHSLFYSFRLFFSFSTLFPPFFASFSFSF